MTDDETSRETPLETEFIDPFADLQDTIEDTIEQSVEDTTEVTIWAPEPGPDSDAIVKESIDEWIESVDFSSTEDVPILTDWLTKLLDKKQVLLLSKKPPNSAATCS